MKIIIMGAGNVGVRIARQLIDENKNVVLIDRDAEKVKLAMNSLDCMVIHGEANSRETLLEAGIEDADFFIGVTESDELNMIACGMVSSEFSVPYKIARVRNIDYSQSKISNESFLGIDYVINPEIEAARAIVRSVRHGATSDIMYFQDSSYEMRTIMAAEESYFVGRTVKDIKEAIGLDFIVAVILRDQDYIIPSGRTVVMKNDTLYLISDPETLESIFSWAGKERVELKHIIIVGGGRIGRYVATDLLEKEALPESIFTKLTKSILHRKQKHKIVMIDSDYEVCQNLSEKFPEVLVIHGDVSEEGFLEDGELTNYDLLIAATGNQELNLITSLYAKSIGIERTLALVQKNNFLHIAAHLNVDTTISLNNSMVNSVLKYIRRGNVKNVHAISGGKLEIIEVSCEEGCDFVGKKIADLKLPGDTLIIFISHDDVNIIPHGQYTIDYGDHIVLITTKEAIKKLDRLLDNRL